ncbi:excinuclease ABC subunit B [Candidatus Shapirobacteria bacterium CG_4_8_14_3_um_filter_35_11]|uniref:UvrABC system protein B n=5 Tax=Candidatus Shapironibacteriota TaxID=1752721 RepID=A0A1J5I2P0_9BACT|nr:MAG: excinuclease ABC subunit B [Candidatus Shapirobacteria bacterium CG2_30_35_20]PJC80435.1 MAG: excinuclease ABC subunit B [Candidatus Shapirobacteria bacterium CG_4_8_14_3_um_filter_35_11]PJE66499.1 MAG: excinuclease ABC subunit B [Candidatus Shapirobacteria bacterium CG10_big_fil_rev_8_21_14_0_10_36_6]
MPFKLISNMTPAGDQPQAIDKLVANLKNKVKKQTLLGVTGSGKTFTIANVIEQTQLPTLIISHNKTLAGQLYQEFKELFPNNKVSYFVSYYDYYQPEAYMPSSDTYIAKEVQINDLIDKLRLEATSNLFSSPNNIVIASVSCIYNIGDPREFGSTTLDLKTGDNWSRRGLFEKLVSLFYTRSELEFKRSNFRVRGEVVEIWPSSADWMIVLEFDESNKLKKITERNPFSGHEFNLQTYKLFPAKQYVGAGSSDIKGIYEKIRSDCSAQVKVFKSQGKMLEAHRLEQRVSYDLEMLNELGFVNGIENYSLYFEKDRKSGDPPYTLIDYFHHLWGDNFLTVIDESHVTIPQIGGMYFGDVARKKTLVDFGFRLKSAYDNRPLKWDEFYSRIPQAIYVSATPSQFEYDDCAKALSRQSANAQNIVEQIIRPTSLVDPPITIKPTLKQIPDLISEIQKRVDKHERTLVVTITKKMSEELAQYLGKTFKVAYLHSDIDTLKRSGILDQLRNGEYDVLVGINLLREGIDLPEVSLVAILDAGQQGFLRSRSALIQIMGRASRHVDGQAILYSDVVSPAMKMAIDEVNRRRVIQQKYNYENNITPVGISKSIRPQIIENPVETRNRASLQPILEVDILSLTPNMRKNHISKLKKEMRTAASDLDFELAIRLRDKILEIEKL